MLNFNCKQCSSKYVAYDSLRKHMSRIHKVNSENFYCEFYLQGKAPEQQFCKCGCKQITRYKGLGIFADYLPGHYARVHNNWGHNPNAIKNSAKTRKKQYDEGTRQVWNKGLDITDPRVAAYAEKMNTPERAAKISAAHLGIPKSPEHIEKLIIILAKNRKELRSKKISKLEKKFEKLLISLNIPYEPQFELENKHYDFKIKDKKILIEIDGDWWHCNKEAGFVLESKIQEYAMKYDKIKNEIASENGFKLLRFWEHDINNNIQQVVKTLLNEL